MSSTNYCIWGLCEPWETCCGYNVCCRESEFNALFVTAVVLGTLLVIASCLTCFYCTSKRPYAPLLKKYFKISYVLMSTERERSQDSTKVQQTSSSNYVVEVEKTEMVT